MTSNPRIPSAYWFFLYALGLPLCGIVFSLHELDAVQQNVQLFDGSRALVLRRVTSCEPQSCWKLTDPAALEYLCDRFAHCLPAATPQPKDYGESFKWTIDTDSASSSLNVKLHNDVNELMVWFVAEDSTCEYEVPLPEPIPTELRR